MNVEMVSGRYCEGLMELCHNGLQAQLRQLTGCDVGKVYIVLAEVVPVDYTIMACARWLEKKGRGGIQKEDISVVGFATVALNHSIEFPDLLVIQLLVFTW